ncbi:MAG: carbohydrate ABC transporter permease [Alphaproteobacteria bacterium]|nr:carbohydrate ABC transporter permease [Alphaproteobacteria bacterium]
MKRVLAYAVCLLTSAIFAFPYLWMLAGSFRTTSAMLTAPLRLWPERFDLTGFRSIAEIGDLSLLRAGLNSLFITGASTAIAVAVTALGAYAITRRPRALAFRVLRYGFLTTMMYPYMLLVIPVYIVVFKLGLLGSYAGIILFLALGPIQFFLFEQFFRGLPGEVIEAATIDGASELTILLRIVLPMAAPIVATVAIITFLLNWAQWFPVLVISSSSDTWTLPVALLNLNGELGTNFQGIMALSVVTTIPVAALFLIAQRRVIAGMTEGAVKG